MGRQAHLAHTESLIKTRRWNDTPGMNDGFKLLITRYRPRALPKAEETWDAWWKELGPSPALFNAVYGKGQPAIAWEEYARRYREEMQASTPRQKIAWLAQSVARGEPVTLLCSSLCTDENRCHRTVLRALLLEEVGQLVAQLGR
jgi:uncharacterized protein YeaO (DUF488 family)